MRSFRQVISEWAQSRWAEDGRPNGTRVQDGPAAAAELRLLSAQARQLAGHGLPDGPQLLRAILEHSPAVISVKDAAGRYLLVNPRYEALFHLTAEQVRGRTDHDFFPAALADTLRANDLQVLAAGAPQEFEEVVPQEGRPHTYLSLKFPIGGPAGAPFAVCGISTDITARKQAQRRLVAEHAVTRALAESAALADAAPRILRALCEGLGWDVGLLWEVDRPANVLGCVAVWHRPAVAVPGFERLSRQIRFPPGGGLPGRVWAGGQPVWLASIVAAADPLRGATALREGLHGACGFPVRNGGETLGVIEFFSREVREPNDEVLAMMVSISSQISQFIERRQAERVLYGWEREFGVARKIQQGLLPKATPVLTGFALGGASQSAQEVGGDYLDYIPLADGSLGIALGDASGHGIGAAMLMAETRAYLRARAATDTDVGAILSLVNRQLSQGLGDGLFVTLLLARLDPRTRSLTYASAGHWPGYVLDARGKVKAVLHSTAMPLGLDPTADVPAAPPLTLGPGELVLLLTDGLVEGFSPEGHLFGIDRVLNAVRAHRDEAPGDIIAALFHAAGAFSQNVQTDDMTAVILKVDDAPDELRLRNGACATGTVQAGIGP